MTSGGDGPLDRIFEAMQAAREDVRSLSIPGFTVLDEIGAGGFGIVYKAHDEKLDRTVAIKLVVAGPGKASAASEAFLNEARALARVKHPNVLAIYGVLEHDGQQALCIEYVDGPPLSDILKERGPLPAAEVIRIGLHLCDALEAVHAAGLVHRDVKTSNVLCETEGRIVLADFGLGVFVSREQAVAQAGSIVGSPVFMSPEQLSGEAVDARSDLYSLGVVLYTLCTGAFPFVGDDFAGLREAICRRKPASPASVRPDVPPTLAGVILTAMEKEPDRRFQNAVVMRDALAACREQTGAPEDHAPASARRSRLVRAIAAAGLVGLVGLVATLALLLTSSASQTFEIIATARVADPAVFRALQDGEPLRTGETFHVTIAADRDVHAYVVHEDRKGRKFLVFPSGGGEGASLVRGRAERPLSAVPLDAGSGWRLPTEDQPAWLLTIVAVDPVGPLEDAVPKGESSPATRKEGYLRLKPVTVRGLKRILEERGAARPGGAAPEDEEEDDDGKKIRVSEFAPELSLAGAPEHADTLWIRKLRVEQPRE